MAFLLDTNVAIYLRDGDTETTAKISALDDAVLMSIVTRVELEGGVYREPAHAFSGVERRVRRNRRLPRLPLGQILAFCLITNERKRQSPSPVLGKSSAGLVYSLSHINA